MDNDYIYKRLDNASLRNQIREPTGVHAFFSEPDRTKDAEIARLDEILRFVD